MDYKNLIDDIISLASEEDSIILMGTKAKGLVTVDTYKGFSFVFRDYIDEDMIYVTSEARLQEMDIAIVNFTEE